MVGPFSDKFGRRMPLILATAVHIAASVGAALSTDIATLGLFRVLMGIGAAGGGVVAMAMVRDLFSGYAMVRMFSRMALVNGLAPILAPVIGSQLLLVMPWPGIFVFLACYGTLVIVAAMFLVRETLPREKRGQSGMTARQRYRALFSDRIFVGLLLVGGMNFGGLFTYLSASPFLFQDIYGFTPQQYGLLFGINSLGIVAGVQTSSRLIRRVPAAVDPGRLHRLDVPDGPADRHLRPAGVRALGRDGAALVLHPRHGLHLPERPGPGAVQPRRAGGHGGVPAGRLHVPDGRHHLTGGGLAGRQLATPMGAVQACCIFLAAAALWLVVRPRTVPSIH